MKRLACSLLLVAGCGSSSGTADMGPPPPPMICKTPNWTGTTWFTEVTAEAGLSSALGTTVRAGDLDGDGWPDLLATDGATGTRETSTARLHFLLMNRPDPNDATKRVFVDTTAESGLTTTRDGMGGRAYGPANFGDLDNDGNLDVVVCPPTPTALDPCAAFLNDGTAHFTLATYGELEDAGVYETVSAALLDYDQDGVLDFWPAAFGSTPYLFHGNGDGTFHETAENVGLPTANGDPAQSQSFRQTFGVTACDLDGDGDLDVLLADYGREANQVWINSGGMFTEVAMSLGVAWDDDMDFSTDDESYLCYCHPTSGPQPSPPCPSSTPMPVAGICPDRGWMPGQSDQPWRLGGNNFSIACGDLDDDGDMDLMTATIRHWDVGQDSDPSEILRNDAPPGGPLQKFVRPGNMATGLYRTEAGGWNEGDMMPVFVDVDLDGRKDIYLSSSDYPGDHGWLWEQQANHSFIDVTGPSGIGQKENHGVAFVDYDGDGDLDVVLGTSTARQVSPTTALRIYRNDIGAVSNWTQVHLTGLGKGHSNVSAIGARVSVTAGGATQIQEVSGGYGHGSMQHDLVLTFGLGATCTVDKIEVRWPDASHTVQDFSNVQANYRVEIKEGESAINYVVRN